MSEKIPLSTWKDIIETRRREAKAAEEAYSKESQKHHTSSSSKNVPIPHMPTRSSDKASTQGTKRGRSSGRKNYAPKSAPKKQKMRDTLRSMIDLEARESHRGEEEEEESEEESEESRGQPQRMETDIMEMYINSMQKMQEAQQNTLQALLTPRGSDVASLPNNTFTNPFRVRDQSMTKPICSYCGRVGHDASSCYSNPANPNRPARFNNNNNQESPESFRGPARGFRVGYPILPKWSSKVFSHTQLVS